VVETADAVLYAWHPGTMAGPALADLLLGIESPSAKLPVTLPRTLGQIPIYYSHKNTGRPTTTEAKGIPLGTPLNPWDFSSRYLDVEISPLFPFGYGLSYTNFEYRDLVLSSDSVALGSSFEASVELLNVGQFDADEVVQLYVRDLVGSVTRPVKELKAFERVRLAPGQRRRVAFRVHTNQLAFWGQDMTFAAEPGRFQLWIGPSSAHGRCAEFRLV
jgi:beta-glucosidase